jgi:Flp pilus assembly protein TadG
MNAVHDERGAVALEFALIVVILLMIVAAVIEFGKAYTEVQVLTGAAREGARHAAVRQNVDDIRDRIDDAADPYAPSEVPSVVVDGTSFASGEPCEDNFGEAVEVSWTQSLELNIMGMPSMDRDVDISGTFRCE